MVRAPNGLLRGRLATTTSLLRALIPAACLLLGRLILLFFLFFVTDFFLLIDRFQILRNRTELLDWHISFLPANRSSTLWLGKFDGVGFWGLPPLALEESTIGLLNFVVEELIFDLLQNLFHGLVDLLGSKRAWA